MNKKISISFKLVIIFFFSIVGCSNEEERKGSFLKRGVELFEQGDYKRSVLEIKNAILEDPKASEPYYYMALLNEKERKFKAMKANLIESVKLNPEDAKAKLKLSKVYLLFNEVDKATKEVEGVLTQNPDQLDALSIKASIFIREENNEDALMIVDGILKKNTDHIEALSLKTIILMKKKSFDEALSILTSALKKHDKNISLHLLKIQLDSKRNDIDSLIADYEKLVDLKPDNIEVKYALANVYIRANKRQKAELLLRSLVDENPKLIKAEIKLLNFLHKVEKEEALNQLDVFIGHNTDNYSSLEVYSKWLISNNKVNKAKELLSEVLLNKNINKENKDNAKLFLAKLGVSNKEFEVALEYIRNVLEGNPENVEAKLLKAKILRYEESYSNAIELLEQILWQKPKMDQAMSLLGIIYVELGEMDKANANFKDALKINPKNLQALNFIVSKEVSEGHIDYSIELLERALSILPSQLTILTKLVELNSIKKNWDAANKYVDRIYTQKNGAILAQYFRGKVLQKQNKYEKAILAYKALLKNYPWLKDALTGMAECFSELNQQAQMREYLGEFINNHPNISFAYVLKSQLLSVVKENLQAIELLKFALKNKEMEHNSIYIEMARLYAGLGEKVAEHNVYINGLSNNPEDINLLLRLASYYEKDGAYNKAVEQYKKILLINSKHNVAKNNLATLLLDNYGEAGDIYEALQLVEVFKQSQQPYFLDTYGWAHLKNGNIDKALSIFKKVILLQPDVPVFRYHLAVAYHRLADTMSASSELKQALYLGKGKVFPEKVLIKELLAKIKDK